MNESLSPDGKWLWNGSEWIPAPPPTTEEVLQQSAPVIDATAQQYNLDPQQLSANTQNFELNQDNTISEYEAQLSAQSMLTPPQASYPKPMLRQPSQSNKKKFLAIGITVLLIGSILFWLLSPSISPISSIHDNDGDGYADSDDKFDDNPTQWVDSDGDGFGDNQDQGATQVDNFTNNPTQWADSDGDGYGDNQSAEATQVDNFTTNPTQWADSDGDGYGDNQSAGAIQVDNFTNNPTQWADTDDDGFGDNQSLGATQVDYFLTNPTQDSDLDGDGFGDNQSSGATQVDNFTNNPTQWADIDGDGFGDNQSLGATQVDNFTNNPTQWIDIDGDGYGDNQTGTFPDNCPSNYGTSVEEGHLGCPDFDNDGYWDDDDDFDNDPFEWKDSDSDGVGDNSDVFPYNSLESQDTDGDGVGDNSDLLVDGDAYIMFNVNSLVADINQSYDSFSAPDMYMKVWLDWDCNGGFDMILTSATNVDDYYVDSSDLMQVTANISESESEICFQIDIWDSDSLDADDRMDYVNGGGCCSILFTENMTQTNIINLVYSAEGYKPVAIDISVYIW